jgi:hypothetical protein
MSILAELNNFPLSCIYIFVDHTSKNFRVKYSLNNGLTALADDLTELKKGVFAPVLQDAYNRGLLEIVVLKEYTETPLRAVIAAEYDEVIRDYVSRGYNDTRGLKCSSYKLNKRILSDYRSPHRAPPLVYITGKTSVNGELVLAIFNTVPQADAWIAETYGEVKDNIVPKFKDDELTLGYHKKYGYKLVMGKTRVKGSLQKRFKGITL